MEGGTFDTLSSQPDGREPGGDELSGREPGGDELSGREPGGDELSGREPGGYEPGGDELSGREPGGDELSGREPGGDEPGGYEPGGREPGDDEPFEHEPDGCEPLERGADGRELGDMTYWRRRFIALTVGLGILSLIAWAFSGTFGASQAGSSTAAGVARASHGHPARAAAGSAGPGSASKPATQPGTTEPAAASPAVRPSASAQPAASPATGAQVQAGPTAAQLAALAPHRAPHPARACKPGDVVLSLVVGQDSYGQGQLPEFDVNVVSTATRTCGFNVGAKHLSLVVRAHGKRVWASAKCAAGHGTLTTNLARGVPVIVPVSWNRQTSALACQGTGQPAPAGRYTASASDGGVSSNPARFTIG